MNIANRYTAADINRLVAIKKSGAFEEVAKKMTEYTSSHAKPIKTYTEAELAPKLDAKFAEYQAKKGTPYAADELASKIESKLAAHRARQARTVAIA